MENAPMDQSPLYNIKQAAHYLGDVSPRHVHNLRKRTPPLRAVKIGGRTMFRRQDLDQFINTSLETNHGHNRNGTQRTSQNSLCRP